MGLATITHHGSPRSLQKHQSTLDNRGDTRASAGLPLWQALSRGIAELCMHNGGEEAEGQSHCGDALTPRMVGWRGEWDVFLGYFLQSDDCFLNFLIIILSRYYCYSLLFHIAHLGTAGLSPSPPHNLRPPLLLRTGTIQYVLFLSAKRTRGRKYSASGTVRNRICCQP